MMLDDDLTANLKKSKIPAWDKEVISEVYRLMKNKHEYDLAKLNKHFKGKHHESQLTLAIAWLQNRHFIQIKKIRMTNKDDTKQVWFQMNPIKSYLKSLVSHSVPSHSRTV